MAVACTPDPPPASAPTATSRTSFRKASPAEVAGGKAVAVYLGMWKSMASAATSSDWRAPSLSQFATGDALNTISGGLYADHQNGFVTRGMPKNAPTVARWEPEDAPTTVTISDCGDSTNWLKYRADNGQPANDGPGGRRAISAVVQKQDGGTWLVTDFAVRAVGTC